ncbi:TetR/AcrR family transcriptional regulator [Streptomyces sp. NBC_01023]|nr:TetR/AcrR family transcriptional regulator [Streptomyces sp. NBC_01023]
MTQIAERTGVTESAFFRHFSDKRELLVADQETLSRLLVDGITEAPASAGPLQAVTAGLKRASSTMGPTNPELGPASKQPWQPAPNSRSAMPSRASASRATMTAALIACEVPDPTAHLAGELGVRALKHGYAQWPESDRDDTEGLAPHALEDMRTATASLD